MSRRREFLERLVLAPLHKRAPIGRPGETSRHNLVARFHELRRLPQPPVLVIQGPLGSGKTELVGRFRATYRRRWPARLRQEIDARLDLTPPKTPEAEFALEVLRRQLQGRASLWRRVPTPRFDLMRAQLYGHRADIGERESTGAVAADLQWALSTGAKAAATIHAGGVPLVVPSLKAGPVRWARQLRVRLGIGHAAKWVKQYRDKLPQVDALGRNDAQVTQALERALTVAMAADLAAATTRKRLNLRQIVVFVDAYDRVENESSNRSWLVELADDLREARAAVMLVLACRRQRLWSERITGDPQRRSRGLFDTSPTVEIHPLHPLEWSDRIFILNGYEVPDDLLERLANVSAGHPLVLRLLGITFGRLSPSEASRLERELLPELPRSNKPDDQWVRKFCAAIAPVLLRGIDDSTAWHARAAAVLRIFNRGLLSLIMGEEFRGEAFAQLVSTPLVDGPKPGSLIIDGEAYRMRAFARQFLHEDDDASEARLRWHELACAHYDELAAKSDTDPEQQFALRVEALLHRSYLDAHGQGGGSDAAGAAFVEALVAEQALRRFDHCEMLLDCASDMYWLPSDWKPRILALSGRMYLVADRYDIAEERLREARRVGELADLPDPMQRGITQSLVACLRLQGRVEAAREELRTVLDETIPVAAFQAVWSDSLIAKEDGDLQLATEQADEAQHRLDDLLAEGADGHAATAAALGFGDLRRKRAHLLRHQADLARRRGNYVASDRLIDEAEAVYRQHPEPVATQRLRLLRSDVLRSQGLSADAEAVAQRVLDEVTGSPVSDIRTGLLALRALAQAILAGAEPERAHPYLLALAEPDVNAYPAARPVGLWGMGELARLEGRYREAADHYTAALRVEPETPAFERCFSILGAAETERLNGRPRQAIDRLKRLADRHDIGAHPAVAFWMHLLRARAHATLGDDDSATRFTDAAGRTLKRMRWCADATPLEPQVLAADGDALQNGGSFKNFHLLLP